MQELRIEVQPSEAELILGFISLLKKQGMFSRAEPKILQLEKSEDKTSEIGNGPLKDEALTEEELVNMLDKRMESIENGNVLTHEELKNKMEKWRAAKLK